jgi:uncharacterized protein
MLDLDGAIAEASDLATFAAPAARHVQFVVKTSKFCNLRCRYCYEYPELGDRRTMSREDLQRMYRSIAEYYGNCVADAPVEIDFVWHGGEPLLVDPDYYWRTFDDQTRIFDDARLTVSNAVQTNLTLIDERRLQLLREGFDTVGVSLDLFSKLRVNQAGRDLQPTVLRHMDVLADSGIAFSCITVLSRANRPHLERIFRFFAESRISFRLLPVFDGAEAAQNAEVGLSEEEILDAYIALFELWLESDAAISIEPISAHVAGVISALTDARGGNIVHRPYDKRDWEPIYLVNTDGQIYCYADAYDPAKAHGSLFNQPMAALIEGSRHLSAIAEAEARMATGCADCRHHGTACTGYPMAEESPARSEKSRCIRERGILDHIERRLLELGIVESETGRLDPRSSYYGRFQHLTSAQR